MLAVIAARLYAALLFSPSLVLAFGQASFLPFSRSLSLSLFFIRGVPLSFTIDEMVVHKVREEERLVGWESFCWNRRHIGHL